jgi:uncharacterized delta-60 repeat protein
MRLDRYPCFVSVSCLISSVGLGCGGGGSGVPIPPDAQYGLDSNFGSGGKMTISAVQPDGKLSVAVQSEGGIVVAGNSAAPQTGAFLLRLTSIGAIDPSFALGGIEHLAFSVKSVALSSGDDIIILGTGLDGRDQIERFDPNGLLDPSFGDSGNVTPSIAAQVVLAQPDGRIVVGGNVPSPRLTTSALAVSRLSANGHADLTFGDAGTALAANATTATALGLEPDGTILALDASHLSSGVYIATFSPAGYFEPPVVTGTVSPVAVSNTAAFATFAPSGEVIVATPVPGTGNEAKMRLQLRRYTTGGTLEGGFGGTFDWAGPQTAAESFPIAVAVEPHGEILVGGGLVTASSHELGFGAFTWSGSLDPSFDGASLVQPTIAGGEEMATLTIQPDGNVVAAGMTGVVEDGQVQLVLARYLVP